MSRKAKKLDDIYDNKTYSIIVVSYKLGCPICPPNKGCNGREKKKQRNWKKFRKHQYKN